MAGAGSGKTTVMCARVVWLVGRGLVSRDDHPGDRRGVLVRLTDQGRTTVDGALAGLAAAEPAGPRTVR